MFIRNVFYTLGTEILSVGANAVIGILLARSLSVLDRGIMVLVMTLPWTVYNLAGLGLQQATIYMVGRKKRDPSIVLGNTLVMISAIGLLAIVILTALKEVALSSLLRGLPEEYWWPLMLLIPAILIDGMLLSILRAIQRFDLFNLRRLAAPPLLLLGFGMALLVFKGGLGAAVAVYVTTTLFMALFSLVLTRRHVPVKLTWDRKLTDKSLRFGFKSYLQNMVGNLSYRIDVYLIALFLSPVEVAIYGVATSLAELSWYIPDAVGVVLLPRLSHEPLEKVHRTTATVCRNTLAITGFVVVGLLAAGWLIIPLLYGPAYRVAVPPLLLLLPGVMSIAIYKVLTRNFTSRDRQQIPILAASVALTLNLSLDLLLIQRWEAMGAATASTIGYTAAGLVVLAFFVRESHLPWHEVLIPRISELGSGWRWVRFTVRGWKLKGTRSDVETSESTEKKPPVDDLGSGVSHSYLGTLHEEP